jgi:hypothetical protein
MKGQAAAHPAEYLARLAGWQLELVTVLRAAIHSAAPFDEAIKWHNLIFSADGPCMMIHTEESRVLLGFWRGKRLAELDPRIKPSGKYELGNITFRADTPVDVDQITRLAAAAGELNRQFGDPTAIR